MARSGDVEFEAFDSLEDLFKRMDEARRAADARVQPWQAAIKPGDYFKRDSGYGFPIYGHVQQEESPREPELRHYRFCHCFSVACTEGEYGDVHVSTIDTLIRQELFEEARQRGWLP